MEVLNGPYWATPAVSSLKWNSTLSLVRRTGVHMTGPLSAVRSRCATVLTDGAIHITSSRRCCRETSEQVPNVTRSIIGPVERWVRSSACTVLTSPCLRSFAIQLHSGAVQWTWFHCSASNSPWTGTNGSFSPAITSRRRA